MPRKKRDEVVVESAELPQDFELPATDETDIVVEESKGPDHSITRSMGGVNANEKQGVALNFPKGSYTTARGLTREDR